MIQHKSKAPIPIRMYRRRRDFRFRGATMARAGAVAELGATTSGRLEVTLCGMAFLPGRNSPSLDLCKAKVVHLSLRSDNGQGGVGFRKLSRQRVGDVARW